METKQPLHQPLTLIAMDVAEAFAAGTSIPAHERHEIMSAAMLVGQHVADRGHPGRWDQFEATMFFEQASCFRASELRRLAILVMAMFQFLGLMGALPMNLVVRLSQKIRDAAPADHALESFHEAFVTDVSHVMVAALPS